MLSIAEESVRESIKAKQSFLEHGLETVVQAAEVMSNALMNGKKVLVFGNGGSSSDAQHFAAELVNRFMLERPSLPCVALGTNPAVVTAIGNDYHFDQIFSKEIKALGNEDDIALGISTSGTSPNVLNGLAAAKERGMVCIGLTGPGGDMGSLCEVVIRATSAQTPRIQEIHSLVIHIMCELIDTKLFGRAR